MFSKTEKTLLSFGWNKWFGIAFFGTIGISLFKTGIMALAELVETNPSPHSNNNGSGTVPWYYLTVYTFGIVFLSYYLGGVFNSQFIEEAENSTSAKLLKLKSQLTLLPISQLIRKHRLEEHRLNIKRTREKSHITGEELDPIKLFVESRDLLIDAIIDGYILPWYNKVSGDTSFLEQSRESLQYIFDQLKERIRLVNRTELSKEIVQTLHCHWKEYCAAIDKIKSPNETLTEKFTFTHSFLSDRNELRKQYEAILCMLLSEILPLNIKSHIFSQFISGILVKGVFLYYTDMISDPKWVNTTLVTLITSGNFVNTCETSSNQSGSNISTALPSPTTGESPSPLICTEDKSPSAFTPNIENAQPQPEALVDEFTPKPDTLMEVVAKKGSIQEFLRLESQRKHGEDTSNGGRSPVFNSIQAALSGLLSATALPLLPDRSSFQEIAQKTEIENESNSLKPEVPSLPIPLEKTKNSPVRFFNDKISNTASSPGRHHSWEETFKSKDMNKQGEKQAKSLDENVASHSFARQEEFDAGLLGNDILANKSVPLQPSPMYDEPEDFAATIAKLRSLLEQKQSQTNLMEEKPYEEVEDLDVNKSENIEEVGVSEPEQIDATPSVPLKSPLSKIRPTLDSQSSSSSLNSNGSGSRSNASHGSIDVEASKMDKILDEEEDIDPVISRFFLNVSIPKTESCGDSSDQFTLYCIQYEGVYIEDSGEDHPPKLVLRTTTVKRSFKEFLTLQNQLEESPIWKPHMRGIKTPNKWMNLSFSNQSSGNNKRNLLERYLQQLCSHPILGFCPDIRHFMAYGDDGFQMFGLPSSGSNRFVKLTKTFTGVLNTLRDALPTFESDSLAPHSDISGISPSEFKGKRLFPSFLQFGDNKNIEESGKISSEQNNYSQDVFEQCENHSNDKVIDGEDLNETEENISNRIDEIEASASLTHTDYAFDTDYPLALAVTNLLCDVLWLPHRKPQSASVSAFMSLSGKSLENYLQESLDIFLSEDAFLSYMDLLTSSVNEWSNSEMKDPEKDELIYSEEDLKKCLKHRVPVWVRWMWGKSRLDLTIDRLVGFFQHSMVNHDFILSIVELIFSKLGNIKK